MIPFKRLRNFRLFAIALLVTAGVMLVSWLLHDVGFHPIGQTSLQNSVVSGAIFIIGFLLAAAISDYKESEKIPAEFAATIEDMYEDARSLQKSYPKFNLELFRKNLLDILSAFREGTRHKRHDARREINELYITFTEMEAAGVPPNYISKLKAQQGLLLRSLFRVNYIQKIKFIPSATVLEYSIVFAVVGMLVLTDIEPYYGGLILTGIITFMLVYMVMLIDVIAVPFQAAGKTQDDVSLFLLREAKAHLQAGVTTKK